MDNLQIERGERPWPVSLEKSFTFYCSSPTACDRIYSANSLYLHINFRRKNWDSFFVSNPLMDIEVPLHNHFEIELYNEPEPIIFILRSSSTYSRINKNWYYYNSPFNRAPALRQFYLRIANNIVDGPGPVWRVTYSIWNTKVSYPLSKELLMYS